MVKRYATLDEMYYNPMKRDQPATCLQRELGFGLDCVCLGSTK